MIKYGFTPGEEAKKEDKEKPKKQVPDKKLITDKPKEDSINVPK